MGNSGQKEGDKYPLAFSTAPSDGIGDRLILVLRGKHWGESTVSDITSTLDGIGLSGRYAIVYLDEVDEAHVVRAG